MGRLPPAAPAATRGQVVRWPDPIESTLDDFVAAAKEVWSRPKGVYRVFDTEAVRDDNHSRVGTSFTGADGRSRVLRGKAPSGPELHRLVKAVG